MAGGGGDPVIEKFDRQTFKFVGVHGRLYNLFSVDGFRVEGRIHAFVNMDGVTNSYFIGCDVYCPAGAEVEARNDGTIAILAGEWSVRIERKFCTLPAREHPKDAPEPASVSLSLPGKCEVYCGLSQGANIFHEGIRSHLTSHGCSLDAPGHFGLITEGDHPLLGVAHMNIKVDGPIIGATGLTIDGDRPDAKAEDYEIGG